MPAPQLNVRGIAPQPGTRSVVVIWDSLTHSDEDPYFASLYSRQISVD